MSRKRKDQLWLSVSIVFFLAFAASFLMMPLGEERSDGGITPFAFAAGLMFWVSLLLGLITQGVLSHRRKVWYANHNSRAAAARKIGLISWFKNRYAAIADVMTLLSLVATVVVYVLTDGVGYICYVMAFLLVFSFCMHCILNGKNFYYVKNGKDLPNTTEKSSANATKKGRKG